MRKGFGPGPGTEEIPAASAVTFVATVITSGHLALLAILTEGSLTLRACFYRKLGEK